ncbi:MAG TPA: LysM peptidoglycan-binding domain-containing protein [Acidimicrobiia bacterium]|jgi:LysM repeat protein|nr:LysM peptidoglycan-binding domain-containing protein [Acidimicrobiia bacterium]
MQTKRPQLSVQLSVLLATVCVVFLLIGGAAGADEVPAATIEYVVAEGDTLWEIASGFAASGQDVRPLISQIKELSGIQSSSLQPGQVLQIPQS